jgi:hypothetical protein
LALSDKCSLLRAGVWAGIDTLLVTLLSGDPGEGDSAFPLDAIQSAMSLRFDQR